MTEHDDHVAHVQRMAIAWSNTRDLIDTSPYYWYLSVAKDAIKGIENAERINKVFNEQLAILEMAARLKE